MMTFTEFLAESKKEKPGTYISVKPDSKSAEKLESFVSGLNLKMDKFATKDDYHTTIAYSRKHIPNANKIDMKLPITADPVNWKVFDSKDGKCLVLAMSDTDLKKFHQKTMDAGGTYDYPEYIPHITIGYGFEGSIPSALPKFSITYTKREISDLDEDFKLGD